jgi:hypothetical protein
LLGGGRPHRAGLGRASAQDRALEKRAGFLLVKTASSEEQAFTGDWIVRLPSGEIYPCTKAIFDKRCKATPRPPRRPDDRPRYSRAALRRAASAGIAEQR